MDTIIIWIILITLLVLIIINSRNFLKREETKRFGFITFLLILMWTVIIFNANQTMNFLLRTRIQVDCVVYPENNDSLVRFSDDVRIVYVNGLEKIRKHNVLIHPNMWPTDHLHYSVSSVEVYKSGMDEKDVLRVSVVNEHMEDRLNGLCTTGTEMLEGQYYLVYGNQGEEYVGNYYFLLEEYDVSATIYDQTEDVKEMLLKVLEELERSTE